MFDRELRPMWIAALDTLQEARGRASVERKMLAHDEYTFRVYDGLANETLPISVRQPKPRR